MQSQVQKVFNPWNLNNKEIQLNDVHHILRRYGWRGRVRYLPLFQQCCVHKSYVDRPDIWAVNSETGKPLPMVERPENCLPLRTADNEELEYLGDSILGCIVATYLVRRYPGQGEGFQTRMRTRIVNNKKLGGLARDAGLGPWMVMSRHVEEVCNGRKNLRMLGSMLEAWIGALYSQEEEPGRGFQVCYDWITNLIETHIDLAQLIHDDTNYKDQLLRYFQANYRVPPKYVEVNAEGPIHDRIFTMGVLDIHGNVLAQAISRNIKDAEQEASRLALIKLESAEEE